MRLSWRDPYQESHNCKSLVVVWFLSMHDTLHRISSLQGEAGMAPPSPGGPRASGVGDVGQGSELPCGANRTGAERAAATPSPVLTDQTEEAEFC